jgi:hypothetical protein
VLCELQHLVERARRCVRTFDAETTSGPEALATVEAFVALERLATSGRLLAAARLDETGAWVGDGTHRDIEGFLAAASGTSVGAARGAMATARRIPQQPAVERALRDGSLSGAQVEAITAAVAADPTAETDLLALAKTAGLKGLKTECDRVRAAAASRDDEVDNYERIHRERCLRHRTMADGSGSIHIRGPLDRTAQIMASLEPLERELFEQNRRTKTIVHPDAVAFDAMVAMARAFTTQDAATENASLTRPSDTRPKTRGARPLATVVVHVSHDAYQRGWTEPGDICEIEGHGPIPVGVARRLAADCILKALVVDGVDVTRVAHLGRLIPAHLRTAIETRDRTCVIAGCEIDRHLEIDHNVPHATRGPTSLENLARVCHHHHAMKTIHDLRRVGPLGRQRLVTTAEFERAGPGP